MTRNHLIAKDGLGAGGEIGHFEIGRCFRERRANAGYGAGPVQYGDFLALRRVKRGILLRGPNDHLKRPGKV
jgi:hypothetical protein